LAIRCTGCGFPLSNDVLESGTNAREFRSCRFCGSETLAVVFPAMFAPPAIPSAAEMTAAIGDATCFYHSSKRASAPCSQCGRFLCALCTVELSGTVMCPECFELGRTRKRIVNLENHRMLHDSIALALAALPVFIIYPSLITGPASVFYSIYYWKRPTSIVRRHPTVRFVIAIILGTLQIALWITLLIFLVYQFKKGTLNRGPR
jgi:hypothetical protein